MKQQQLIQDETQQHQKQKQKAQNEALLTLTLGQSPTQQFNSILMKQFREMNGSTQEKVKRLFNRLQKFFLRDKGARINIKDGYFCRKREPFYKPKGVHIVDNQIILFGVDFAKHRDIIRAYQPEDICPIDMSHVKLIYTNFYAAMQALRRNQRQGVDQNSLKLQQDTNQPSKGWMQMKPYYISNYERRVLGRFATSEQLQIVNTRKLQCNIPMFAKKVYDLKKRESEDVLQNYRLREQKLQIKKQQKRQKRSNIDNSEDHDRDNLSDKSYTLNIGKGKDKSNEEDDKSSVSYRERSRQKDFDKVSVCSKGSSLSNLARMANKMNLDDRQERQSVVSDASFILEQNQQHEEVFRDMAMRLAGMNMDQKRREQSDISFELPKHEQSFVSSASSQSYRLSDNMPDRRSEEHDSSFARKPWSYTEYRDKQERQEEQKKQQEKEIVIVIEDD